MRKYGLVIRYVNNDFTYEIHRFKRLGKNVVVCEQYTLDEINKLGHSRIKNLLTILKRTKYIREKGGE